MTEDISLANKVKNKKDRYSLIWGFVQVHGYTYDYREVVSRKRNVDIICSIHGKFTQDKYSHLKGMKCAACGKRKKLTYEEFVERAKNVHSEEYDYTEVVYKNIDTKVSIKCKKCGNIFQQTPNEHLHGSGCPYCYGKNRLSNEEFIARSMEIHGDKYDYDDVVYVNYSTKVKIRCKADNKIFYQTPANHLKGKGCPYCSGRIMDREMFIEKAKKIHKDDYDYGDVVYENAITKIKILCNKCKKYFLQTPNAHLNGQGCPNCYGNLKKDTETFIKEAREVHGDRYDYSEVDYKNIDTKVKIICKEHGVFEQIPYCHLIGNGCPVCNNSSLEEEVRRKLTELKIDFIEEKKFDWLKYKSFMYLDFYLTEYNTAIECQGIQHFAPIKVFGGDEAFELNQKRDFTKYTLCKDNKIELLYFMRDTDIDKFTMLNEDNKRMYSENTFSNIDELLTYIVKKKREN